MLNKNAYPCLSLKNKILQPGRIFQNFSPLQPITFYFTNKILNTKRHFSNYLRTNNFGDSFLVPYVQVFYLLF